MNGVLLVNGYIKEHLFSSFYQLIIKAFEKEDISIKLVKSSDIDNSLDVDPFENQNIDFILFFDKDIALLKHLENLSYRVFNSSFTVEICEDKALTHLELQKYKVRMPKTRFNAFSYRNEFLNNDKLFKGFTFPVIVKERIGSLGEQVYLVNNVEDFNCLKAKLSSKIIIQEYLPYHYHEDIRVYVVNHHVVAACKRIGADHDFRANCFQGGKMEEYHLDEDFKLLCENISKYLHMDFGGLDFILDENNKPYFIEANSNAQFINFYKYFNINIASFIASYIKKSI